MLQMALLMGFVACGGLLFVGVALILGFLCMVYDRDAFGGKQVGIMMFIAGVIGLIAGGVFGIYALCEIQQQAIPPMQALAGGTWV